MGNITIPNSFTAGTTANASHVNSNFSAITSVVNGNLDATNLSTPYFYNTVVIPIPNIYLEDNTKIFSYSTNLDVPAGQTWYPVSIKATHVAHSDTKLYMSMLYDSSEVLGSLNADLGSTGSNNTLLFTGSGTTTHTSWSQSSLAGAGGLTFVFWQGGPYGIVKTSAPNAGDTPDQIYHSSVAFTYKMKIHT